MSPYSHETPFEFKRSRPYRSRLRLVCPATLSKMTLELHFSIDMITLLAVVVEHLIFCEEVHISRTMRDLLRTPLILLHYSLRVCTLIHLLNHHPDSSEVLLFLILDQFRNVEGQNAANQLGGNAAAIRIGWLRKP